MYNKSAQMTAGRRQRQSGVHSSAGRKKQHRPSQSQENIRLVQLLVCLVLFFTVFIGKGVFPDKMVQLGGDIRALLSSNIDLQGALTNLGASLSEEEGTLLESLGDFCIQVFGTGEVETQPELSSNQSPILTNLLDTEVQLLSASPARGESSTSLYTKYAEELSLVTPDTGQESTAPESTESVEAPEAVPAAGTILLQSDYSGQPLPEDYTMDWLSLGELETVTPVLGHLNSEYGYRDHPINGECQFHGGVDIGGQTGDTIAAFADGTVEYIGENLSYGLYMQIDHGNGVKSFYAHCSKICVSKGQTVAVGEKIGEVGSSGTATGPHLHLELKYHETHLNPVYYVEFLSEQ